MPRQTEKVNASADQKQVYNKQDQNCNFVI